MLSKIILFQILILLNFAACTLGLDSEYEDKYGYLEEREQGNSFEKSSSSSVSLHPIIESSSSIGNLSEYDAVSQTLNDFRDGKIYRTVTIGDQVWMAENLNYETNYSYCYGGDYANCQKYGRLYTWSDAKEACPSGWHLPSKMEFEVLLANTNGQIRSNTWVSGDDVFGFSLLPAGRRNSAVGFYYDDLNNLGVLWSSSEDFPLPGDTWFLFVNLTSALMDYSFAVWQLNVRCIMD